MIKVNSSNIETTKNEMLEQINNILAILDKINDKIHISNEIFNTPASKYFQEQSVNLINNQKEEINNDLIPFVNGLDMVINTYNNYLDEIEKKVG